MMPQLRSEGDERMNEYIVNVPDKYAKLFISRFGLEDVKLLGYSLIGEIVRCKDCKFADEDHYGAWGRNWHCQRSGDVEPDGFCAWGERKMME